MLAPFFHICPSGNNQGILVQTKWHYWTWINASRIQRNVIEKEKLLRGWCCDTVLPSMVEDEVTIGCIIHAGLTRGSDQTNHSLFSPCLLSFDDQFQAPQWTEKERENVSNPDSESSCLSRKLELSLFKIPGYSIEYAYQRRGSKISEITQWGSVARVISTSMREGAALIIIIRNNDCYSLQVLSLPSS